MYGFLFAAGILVFPVVPVGWGAVFIPMEAGAGLLGDDGAGILMLAGLTRCVQLCSARGASKALPSLTTTPHTDLPREIWVLHRCRSCIL